MSDQLDTREATEDEGDQEYDSHIEAPLDPGYLERLSKETDR